MACPGEFQRWKPFFLVKAFKSGVAPATDAIRPSTREGVKVESMRICACDESRSIRSADRKLTSCSILSKRFPFYLELYRTCSLVASTALSVSCPSCINRRVTTSCAFSSGLSGNMQIRVASESFESRNSLQNVSRSLPKNSAHDVKSCSFNGKAFPQIRRISIEAGRKQSCRKTPTVGAIDLRLFKKKAPRRMR